MQRVFTNPALLFQRVFVEKSQAVALGGTVQLVTRKDYVHVVVVIVDCAIRKVVAEVSGKSRKFDNSNENFSTEIILPVEDAFAGVRVCHLIEAATNQSLCFFVHLVQLALQLSVSVRHLAILYSVLVKERDSIKQMVVPGCTVPKLT